MSKSGKNNLIPYLKVCRVSEVERMFSGTENNEDYIKENKGWKREWRRDLGEFYVSYTDFRVIYSNGRNEVVECAARISETTMVLISSLSGGKDKTKKEIERFVKENLTRVQKEESSQ